MASGTEELIAQYGATRAFAIYQASLLAAVLAKAGVINLEQLSKLTKKHQDNCKLMAAQDGLDATIKRTYELTAETFREFEQTLARMATAPGDAGFSQPTAGTVQ
jgi:hypothetical protein